jgi:hypothetical protein
MMNNDRAIQRIATRIQYNDPPKEVALDTTLVYFDPESLYLTVTAARLLAKYRDTDD